MRKAVVVLTAVAAAASSACSGSSTRAVAPVPSPSNGCTVPPPAARQAVLASLRGGSTVVGLSSYALVFRLPRPHLVDVLAARVTTPLPSMGVTQLAPRWAWSDGRLFTMRGDAGVASFGLPPFAGAGGGLEEAGQAADACVTTTGRAGQAVASTVADVPTSPGAAVRVSGALSGTIRGALTCMGGQAGGSYTIGRSRLALQISSNGVNVSVVHPPGGAPLWVFLALPPAADTGVRPGSRAVAFHIRIPYDPMQHSGGRAPVTGLGLDGTLNCA